MYSITGEDVKVRLSEIIKVNVFSTPLLEQKYIQGSISIENISFYRNCDNETTSKCKECHECFYLG